MNNVVECNTLSPISDKSCEHSHERNCLTPPKKEEELKSTQTFQQLPWNYFSPVLPSSSPYGLTSIDSQELNARSISTFIPYTSVSPICTTNTLNRVSLLPSSRQGSIGTRLLKNNCLPLKINNETKVGTISPLSTHMAKHEEMTSASFATEELRECFSEEERTNQTADENRHLFSSPLPSSSVLMFLTPSQNSPLLQLQRMIEEKRERRREKRSSSDPVEGIVNDNLSSPNKGNSIGSQKTISRTEAEGERDSPPKIAVKAKGTKKLLPKRVSEENPARNRRSKEEGVNKTKPEDIPSPIELKRVMILKKGTKKEDVQKVEICGVSRQDLSREKGKEEENKAKEKKRSKGNLLGRNSLPQSEVFVAVKDKVTKENGKNALTLRKEYDAKRRKSKQNVAQEVSKFRGEIRIPSPTVTSLVLPTDEIFDHLSFSPLSSVFAKEERHLDSPKRKLSSKASSVDPLPTPLSSLAYTPQINAVQEREIAREPLEAITNSTEYFFAGSQERLEKKIEEGNIFQKEGVEEISSTSGITPVKQRERLKKKEVRGNLLLKNACVLVPKKVWLSPNREVEIAINDLMKGSCVDESFDFLMHLQSDEETPVSNDMSTLETSKFNCFGFPIKRKRALGKMNDTCVKHEQVARLCQVSPDREWTMGAASVSNSSLFNSPTDLASVVEDKSITSPSSLPEERSLRELELQFSPAKKEDKAEIERYFNVEASSEESVSFPLAFIPKEKNQDLTQERVHILTKNAFDDMLQNFSRLSASSCTSLSQTESVETQENKLTLKAQDGELVAIENIEELKHGNEKDGLTTQRPELEVNTEAINAVPVLLPISPSSSLPFSPLRNLLESLSDLDTLSEDGEEEVPPLSPKSPIPPSSLDSTIRISDNHQTDCDSSVALPLQCNKPHISTEIKPSVPSISMQLILHKEESNLINDIHSLGKQIKEKPTETFVKELQLYEEYLELEKQCQPVGQSCCSLLQSLLLHLNPQLFYNMLTQESILFDLCTTKEVRKREPHLGDESRHSTLGRAKGSLLHKLADIKRCTETNITESLSSLSPSLKRIYTAAHDLCQQGISFDFSELLQKASCSLKLDIQSIVSTILTQGFALNVPFFLDSHESEAGKDEVKMQKEDRDLSLFSSFFSLLGIGSKPRPTENIHLILLTPLFYSVIEREISLILMEKINLLLYFLREPKLVSLFSSPLDKHQKHENVFSSSRKQERLWHLLHAYRGQLNQRLSSFSISNLPPYAPLIAGQLRGGVCDSFLFLSTNKQGIPQPALLPVKISFKSILKSIDEFLMRVMTSNFLSQRETENAHRQVGNYNFPRNHNSVLEKTNQKNSYNNQQGAAIGRDKEKIYSSCNQVNNAKHGKIMVREMLKRLPSSCTNVSGQIQYQLNAYFENAVDKILSPIGDMAAYADSTYQYYTHMQGKMSRHHY